MNKLVDLYQSHEGKVSDKWWSYLQTYDGLFSDYSNRPIRILEIGIQNGGSLEIWAKYFPNAEVIVGCDINPLCSQLSYTDSRIAVVVGNANEEKTLAAIMEESDKFDIIIDDGSHQSKDIIKTFSLYYPLIKEGGLFIVEDLHCSYWEEYQGGIEAPHSSINFFKRLSDYVNSEHWGVDIPIDTMLSYYSNQYNLHFNPISLKQITEVRFRNSIVAVLKGSAEANSLGIRIVSGKDAYVEENAALVDGTYMKAPDQTNNAFGPLSTRIEDTVREMNLFDAKATQSAKTEEYNRRKQLEQANLEQHKQRQLDRTERALFRARNNPLEPLGQFLGFYLFRTFRTVCSPISKTATEWADRKIAKYNPTRRYLG